MTQRFNDIPKNHPSYFPEKRLFRFQSGDTVFESVKKAFEITDFASLENIVRAREFQFEELTVSPYAYDDRIGWLTYLVCIDGKAIGYTNHSLETIDYSKLPKGYVDIQYHQVMETNRILTHLGFFQYAIDRIKAVSEWNSTKLAEVYDQLHDEDLAGEPYSEMYHLYRNNPPKDVAINDLRERMKQYIRDIKEYLGVKEDSQVVPTLLLLQQKQLDGIKTALED